MGSIRWLSVLCLSLVLGLGIGLSMAEANGSSSTDNLGPGHNEWSNDPILYGREAREGVTGSGEFGGSTGTRSNRPDRENRKDRKGGTTNPGGSIVTPGTPPSATPGSGGQ
jgi:hypothetical protein